jgi:hypothetical protein
VSSDFSYAIKTRDLVSSDFSYAIKTRHLVAGSQPNKASKAEVSDTPKESFGQQAMIKITTASTKNKKASNTFEVFDASQIFFKQSYCVLKLCTS